jgi:hypothetical protein
VPSEAMRAKAREWWTNPEYPEEVATEHEVDTLAALLDEVRRDGFAGGLEEAARIVAAHALLRLHLLRRATGSGRGRGASCVRAQTC